MPRNLFTSMTTPTPQFRTQTELPPRPVANACSAAVITALAAAAFDVAAKKPMPAKVQIADRECCSMWSFTTFLLCSEVVFFLPDLYSVWSYPVLCSHDRVRFENCRLSPSLYRHHCALGLALEIFHFCLLRSLVFRDVASHSESVFVAKYNSVVYMYLHEYTRTPKLVSTQYSIVMH